MNGPFTTVATIMPLPVPSMHCERSAVVRRARTGCAHASPVLVLDQVPARPSHVAVCVREGMGDVGIFVYSAILQPHHILP